MLSSKWWKITVKTNKKELAMQKLYLSNIFNKNITIQSILNSTQFSAMSYSHPVSWTFLDEVLSLAFQWRFINSCQQLKLSELRLNKSQSFHNFFLNLVSYSATFPLYFLIYLPNTGGCNWKVYQLKHHYMYGKQFKDQ